MPYRKSFIVIEYPLTANFTQGQEIACAASVNGVPVAHICKLDRLVREIIFVIYGPAGPLAYTVPSGSKIALTVKEFENDAPMLGLSKERFSIKIYTDSSRREIYEQTSAGALTLFSCNDGFFYSQGECMPCVQPCMGCYHPGTVCYSCDQTVFSRGTLLYKGFCYVPIACPTV